MLKRYMFSDEVTAIKYNGLPVATNRYDTKVKLVTVDGEYTRLLKNEELYLAPSELDTYMYVELMYQYDPFKIAVEHYGNENFYWVILAANNLFSLFDLKEGMTIRIPAVTRVIGYNGILVRGDEL